MKAVTLALVDIALFAFAPFAMAQQSTAILIKDADVYTGKGAPQHEVSILVQDGHIAGIGKNLEAPKGARVIEAKGKRVYPGLIDSGTALGLSEVPAEAMTVDTGEIGQYMPQLRAITSVNPDSEHFPVSRVNGITGAITFPSEGGGGGGRGPRQVIAGQAAMIHTDGWTWEQMAIKPSVAMHMIFPTLTVVPGDGPGGGGRGGNGPARTYADAKRNYDKQLREIDDFFENTRRYKAAKAAAGPDFKPDLVYEAMLPVIDGSMPLAITATRERAILDAIAFAERQKVKIVILEPRELGKAAAELKEKNIPVIFGRTFSLPLNRDDAYDSAFRLPAEAYQAGIKFAFGTFDNEFVRDLPYDAAAAVAFGLPYEEAIKAMTINPAEIWGVASQVGSIEEGKVADLVIADGDILETPTKIEQVLIQGKPVDLTNKQTRLYERYLNRPE